MTDPQDRAGAGAAGVRPGGGDQGATLSGETTGAGGDTSPAAVDGTVDAEAQEVVTDVFVPDGERQDDGAVRREPTAENGVVVEGDNVSPELADAAAAEINAAETQDAATESLRAPGGEAAPDPK
ncbi:MAG TPA: hypothetical protein VK402_19625 [Blastococcus sp.]|nr:hypothetical protein [Blastococcus sp.]